MLTNGRTWYFYNAHYPKPLAEKRVFQIQDLFSGPQAVEMLARLSRESMVNGGLTQAWAATRTAEIVRRQLQTPNSPVRKTLKKVIAEELHAHISDSLLGEIIEREIFLTAASIAVPEPALSVAVSGEPSAPVVPEPDDLFTLDYLEKHPELVTGKKPIVVKLLGGPAQPIKSWSVLAQKTLVAIGAKYGLPTLPFVGSLQGEKYFLNTSATHGGGKPMITHVSIVVNETTIYVDMNQSAISTVQKILLFLKATHTPLDAVKLKTE